MFYLRKKTKIDIKYYSILIFGLFFTYSSILSYFSGNYLSVFISIISLILWTSPYFVVKAEKLIINRLKTLKFLNPELQRELFLSDGNELLITDLAPSFLFYCYEELPDVKLKIVDRSPDKYDGDTVYILQLSNDELTEFLTSLRSKKVPRKRIVIYVPDLTNLSYETDLELKYIKRENYPIDPQIFRKYFIKFISSQTTSLLTASMNYFILNFWIDDIHMEKGFYIDELPQIDQFILKNISQIKNNPELVKEPSFWENLNIFLKSANKEEVLVEMRSKNTFYIDSDVCRIGFKNYHEVTINKAYLVLYIIGFLLMNKRSIPNKEMQSLIYSNYDQYSRKLKTFKRDFIDNIAPNQQIPSELIEYFQKNIIDKSKENLFNLSPSIRNDWEVKIPSVKFNQPIQ
jgi:hypothetical protein